MDTVGTGCVDNPGDHSQGPIKVEDHEETDSGTEIKKREEEEEEEEEGEDTTLDTAKSIFLAVRVLVVLVFLELPWWFESEWRLRLQPGSLCEDSMPSSLRTVLATVFLSANGSRCVDVAWCLFLGLSIDMPLTTRVSSLIEIQLVRSGRQCLVRLLGDCLLGVGGCASVAKALKVPASWTVSLFIVGLLIVTNCLVVYSTTSPFIKWTLTRTPSTGAPLVDTQHTREGNRAVIGLCVVDLGCALMPCFALLPALFEANGWVLFVFIVMCSLLLPVSYLYRRLLCLCVFLYIFTTGSSRNFW